MNFSKATKSKLEEKGFEITCEEENIWILDNGESSVTLSGSEKRFVAIWQDFEGSFNEYSSSSLNEILDWSESMLGN